ncbi:hypothetical protein D0N36_11740 [Hymenobacter lapidiphilus]|uniref:hypothetical protein n=1 Tax=Hymenobacter sp. CCM 8763 TaxID=2303334 RepID=UPI000E344465|nr:hypothetical protein [Hymenobacter sp. CCM 8763]RFP64848.1 hypothetical protein D0N36_11740 [Hymenobacter sp. CCM 8763]
MKALLPTIAVLLALPMLSSATPPTLGPAANSTAVVVSVQGDIMITRDPNEVKGLKKLGEIEGRSPFFGLSGKLGDKGATKKLKEAAAALGATKVLIVSEDRMGATTLRGIAYK